MKHKILIAVAMVTLLWSCSDFEDNKAVADKIVSDIELMIQNIESDLAATVEGTFALFKDPETYKSGRYDDAVYTYHDDVIYHNPKDQGHGKFLYSGYYPVGEKEKEKVKTLEHAIPLLKWLADDSSYSDYITQTYLITFDTLIVFYPYGDLLAFIPPKRNIQDRGGWKLINEENNPKKTFKWTTPYIDTTGKGFIVDIMSPVYRGDKMEAYIGIDITISTLKEKFLNITEEKILLIDKQTAQIMAISPAAVEALGVDNIKAFLYLEMIENIEKVTQVMPDNLVLTKTESPHMKALWDNIENEEFTILIGGAKHKVYKRLIESPQWYIVLIE